MFLGIAIIIIFLIFATLMYTNKLSALLALPAMAVLIAAFAGIPVQEILDRVISQGTIRLSMAIMTVFFGAMLGQFINQSGIAETLIKKAAELAGDRPFAVGLALTIVIALLFTVLGGLGAVIMVATIVLPIMLSIGIAPITAGCLFLMGLSMGGILNLTNWQLYISILGLPQASILKFSLVLAAIFFLVTILFLIIELKRNKGFATFSELKDLEVKKDIKWPALLTPLVPLVIVLGFSLYNLIAQPQDPFNFPIVTAMIIGLIYGGITTYQHDGKNLNRMTKYIFDGIGAVAPAVVLIMGIGMLLNAVMHPQVAKVISPLLSNIMPQNAWQYVLFFMVLAPLALYRGPLNIWGMGSGLIGLMLATRSMMAVAIMGALMSVGQIQGVCDPTNTHNVWIANFLKIDVQQILRRTILYVWLIALLGLIIAGIKYF